MIQSEQDVLHRSGDLLLISRQPTEPQALDLPAQDEPPGEVKDAHTQDGDVPPFFSLSPHSQRRALLPGRGISYAVIAGLTAGVLSALFTILVIVLNTPTFEAATQ
jgi:hypothetical protein